MVAMAEKHRVMLGLCPLPVEALGSGTHLEEAYHQGQFLVLFLPLCFLFCHEVTSFLLHIPDTVIA